jgi:REP element-mobilizing transposase RayT
MTLPNRRSVRLPNYDYATPGGYFITICTQNRNVLFDDARLRAIVETAWEDIPNHHPDVEIDDFVVMPNHVHGVLFLAAAEPKQARAQQVAPLRQTAIRVAPGALGAIVRAFKARVTRDVRAALGSDVTVWQRNYHEHVIRHESALRRIRQYIVDNPERWEADAENPVGRPDQAEREFSDWLRGMAPHVAPRIGARP